VSVAKNGVSGPTQKAPRATRIFAILGVIVPIALVILACSGTEAATTTSGGSTPSSSGTHGTTQKAAKVGDTITINGEGATLVSVKQIQPGQYDTAPASGSGYYKLHVKITNTGSDPADFNPIDFKVLTGQGSTIDETFYLSTEPDNAMLQSGQIAHGGSVEGDLLFEVGTKDSKAELIWQPGFDQSLDHAWNLGL
jgi:hypothetical protein